MKLLREGNLGNRVMNKLIEEENSFLTTFMNKYKPLYDTPPVLLDGKGTVLADQIQLRGSGISKRVEAVLFQDTLHITNEDIAQLCYFYPAGIDAPDIFDDIGLRDKYMNDEEFKAKLDKAVENLYKDMVKLRGVLLQDNKQNNTNDSLGEAYDDYANKGELANFPYEPNNDETKDVSRRYKLKYKVGKRVLIPGEGEGTIRLYNKDGGKYGSITVELDSNSDKVQVIRLGIDKVELIK